MNVTRWCSALLLFLTSACARPSGVPTPDDGTKTLAIVATTDVHGHIESLPWLSGHVRNLRARLRPAGGDVLLVDAGDMWQGTLESNLTEGAAVVRAYNALGVHAAAIGNHEFDFGPLGPDTVPRRPTDNPTGNLETRAREARFPLLAANVRTRDGAPWTPPNVRPSTIVRIAGVRVGLIGVTTISTPRATDPRNLVRLSIAPLLDVVTSEARRLRASGATVVVLLAHAGGRCERFDAPTDLSSCNTRGEIFQLAQALPAGLVDAIAAGHNHDGIAHEVNGMPIVEAFHQGRAFGRIDLEIDRRSGRVARHRIHPPRYLCDGERLRDIPSWAPDACSPPAYEGRPVVADRRLIDVVRADISTAERRRAQSLGAVATHPFWHVSANESPASNLVVDLLRAAVPESDVVIYNATGTRASLPAGPITYAGLYALLPFDSVVASGRLPASAVAEAILRAVTRGPVPILSGLDAEVTCDAGTPRVRLWRNGQLVADDTMLTVTTSEFLSSGGAGYFPDLADRFELRLDLPMREAIIGAVPGQADAFAQDRIGTYDAAHKRVRTPGGTFPVRCTP